MNIKLSRLIQKGLQNPIDFLRIILNLPKFIKLYYRLLLDRRVLFYLKLMLTLALVYVISPIDLIPDWMIPLFGYMDDLVVLFVALKYFLKNCPADVIQEHVARIEMGE